MAGFGAVCVLAAFVASAAAAAAASNSSLVSDIIKGPILEVGRLWMVAMHDVSDSLSIMISSRADLASPWTYLWTVVIAFSLYCSYGVFLAPYSRTKLLGDLGYIPESGMSVKDMVNIVRKRRKVGDLPPVYPNGWFSILEARDLKAGQVTQVNCLGLTLAVFRGTSGRALAVDAYCPHLGANLAVGGRVKGNCVECPFHGWQFDGASGKCTTIPYIEGKIPDTAKVKSYMLLERNGFIYLWYHSEGSEPTWEPPVVEEIENGDWTYRGRTEHIINCHIEDVSENGADVAHLPQVHSAFMTSGTDLRFMRSRAWEFAKHLWDASWTPHESPDEKHIGSMRVLHTASFFGIHLKMLDFKVTAKQIGPGIVYLFFEGFSGKGTYLLHTTPMEPLMQRVIIQVSIPWYLPSFIAKFYMLGEAIQMERDIMIWNNKSYELKPVLVKSSEDKTLARHRRWYSQFYSENSPRFSFQKDTLQF